MDPKISIVIPTYNESDNILTLLNKIHSTLGEIPHEILVVDDDSPDKTWERVENFSRQNLWVRVLRRMKKRGLSSAVMDGFASVRGRLLGVMDADLSHDARILPALIQAVDEGADLAIGSRRVPGGGATHWPWYRRVTSAMATLLAKHLLRLPIADPMSGYFVLRRELYEAAKEKINPRGYKILVELYVKSNPQKIREIPYIFVDRKQGTSKMSVSVIGQYLEMLALLMFRRR